MGFVHGVFWFCAVVFVVGVVLINLISNDNEPSEDKAISQWFVFIACFVLIAIALLAALAKWIF